MRQFLLVARKAKTIPDFSLNDLPGTGRMDLVCRCIAQALFISEAIRKDTIIHVCMLGGDPRVVSFDGSRVKRLYPDERNVASHVRIALQKGLRLKEGEAVESETGISVQRTSFERFIQQAAQHCKLVYLSEHGKDIREYEFPSQPLFIIGNHLGLTRKQESYLHRFAPDSISVGPLTYLASQVIVLIHNELDRRQI